MIAGGAVDMRLHPEITVSWLLKRSYYIPTLYPDRPHGLEARRTRYPDVNFEVFWDEDDQQDMFVGHEWLGKMVSGLLAPK